MKKKRFIKKCMAMGYSRNCLDMGIRRTLAEWRRHPEKKFSYEYNFEKLSLLLVFHPAQYYERFLK